MRSVSFTSLAARTRRLFDRTMPGRHRKLSLAALALAGAVVLSGLVLPKRARQPAPVELPAPAATVSVHTPPASTGLDCAQARTIVAEVRERLAAHAPSPDQALFAELLVGWLDPHGLWSAAPDAPAGAYVYEHATELRHELESPSGDCVQALLLGTALEGWVLELAELFDEARRDAVPEPRADAYALAASEIFEDDPVTRPSRELARELGRRTRAFELAFTDLPAELGDQARARYFPERDAEAWRRAVLGAAVRSYVAAVDPHGQWVPREEEASLYLDDPSFGAESRLWGDMMRTALGVRVIDAPAPPLEVDDLVLAVDGVVTAGLSVEHVEEIGLLPPDESAAQKSVLVLRQGQSQAALLAVELGQASGDAPASSPIDAERIRFGDSTALVLHIADVPEDLGHELAAVVSEVAREADVPSGILLDLRGNGGGSTEGACGALGVFLPGAPVFPLLHRGRLIEVLSAATPARSGRWRGPVAALVDAHTASAAEMIAGGLERYGRGVSVGARTFGKGCVQEYFEDSAGAGVLRLTTLLFTLPDGASLQRVGLEPKLQVDVDGANEVPERESDLDGALAPQSGPDIRAAAWFGGPTWPSHHGRVGPCSDPGICASLRRLGTSASAARHDPSSVRRGSATH